MTEPVTLGRYPGYDVLNKRDTPSWNDQTRTVIDTRLSVVDLATFFDPAEWRTMQAVCARILPQPPVREPVPLAAYVDRQLASGKLKGFRFKDMPQPAEAWRRGLAALDEAASRDGSASFADLAPAAQDAMLKQVEDGTLQAEALRGMPPKSFWSQHVMHDVVGAYYAHPTAWSEIGWAGPASPRGYVRLDNDRRDPWEPVEATPGQEAKAERENKRVI